MSPVLDGENKNEILTLTGKNIVIKGIHFVNAGYSSMNDYAALKIIDATNIVIENNSIQQYFFCYSYCQFHSFHYPEQYDQRQ